MCYLCNVCVWELVERVPHMHPCRPLHQSQSLKPEWARAATELKEINPDVLVGNVCSSKCSVLLSRLVKMQQESDGTVLGKIDHIDSRAYRWMPPRRQILQPSLRSRVTPPSSFSLMGKPPSTMVAAPGTLEEHVCVCLGINLAS